MQSAGENAQILRGAIELGRRLSEERSSSWVGPVDACLCHAERKCEAHHPLLGAVVKVPLDASALPVRGFDNAPAGLQQRVLVGAQVGREPFTVDRDGDDPAGGPDQLRVIDHRRVVPDRAHSPTGELDLRGAPLRSGGR